MACAVKALSNNRLNVRVCETSDKTGGVYLKEKWTGVGAQDNRHFCDRADYWIRRCPLIYCGMSRVL